MSYENCFDCPFFKSKPERCISKNLKKDCCMEPQIDKQTKREIIDEIISEWKSEIYSLSFSIEQLEMYKQENGLVD